MVEREGVPGDPPQAHGPTVADVAGPPTVAELRDVNERLLIAGLREQELAVALAAERATLEAERARLAVILADMGDAVLVVDPTGAIIRTNAAYARMAGGPDLPLTPRDAQGHVLPATDMPQARAGRGETFSQEFTLTAADGSQRWYEANGQPLHDSGAGHAVVVIRDITSSSAQRRLQDEFLSLASHELRTPLTSIRGYIDLLLVRVRSTSDDERLVLYATRALSQMRRLTALVGDLTDVARLQSGKLTLVLTAVELGAVVERVVETARDLPPGHTIHLAAAADPLWLTGDAGRLEQILFNLLTNAVAHAPQPHVNGRAAAARGRGGRAGGARLWPGHRGRSVAPSVLPFLPGGAARSPVAGRIGFGPVHLPGGGRGARRPHRRGVHGGKGDDVYGVAAAGVACSGGCFVGRRIMPISFDRAAEYYDETRGYPPGVAARIGEALRDAAGATPSSRLLELGVGTGRVALPIVEAGAGYHYTGIDLSARMMDVLRVKLREVPGAAERVTLVEGDIMNLPFADGSFDAVLTTHVYHLVADRARVAAESARVLARPGVLLNGRDETPDGGGRQEVMAAWDDILRASGWRRPDGGRHASNERVADEWRRLGAMVDEIEGPEWETTRTPAQEVASMAKRQWSGTWAVPDDIFDEAIARLRAWAAEHYGAALDTHVPRRRHFVIERGRL